MKKIRDFYLVVVAWDRVSVLFGGTHRDPYDWGLKNGAISDLIVSCLLAFLVGITLITMLAAAVASKKVLTS